jgi:hypothetical protein
MRVRASVQTDDRVGWKRIVKCADRALRTQSHALCYRDLIEQPVPLGNARLAFKQKRIVFLTRRGQKSTQRRRRIADKTHIHKIAQANAIHLYVYLHAARRTRFWIGDRGTYGMIGPMISSVSLECMAFCDGTVPR